MPQTDETLLHSMRENVADLLVSKSPYCTFGDSPFDYVRSLRMHNNDLDASIKYMRQTMRVQAVDPSCYPQGIYNRDPKVIEEYAHITPMKPFCYSKNGYVLTCDICGLMDPRGFALDPDASWFSSLQDLKHRRSLLYNGARDREVLTGRESGLYLIWDLKDLPTGKAYFVKHLMAPTWQLMEFFENYCKGMVKAMVGINTPYFLKTMFPVIKPFLGQRVRELLTPLTEDYVPCLLEDFDKDELPKNLGGNRVLDESDDYQYCAMVSPKILKTVDHSYLTKFKVHHGFCLTATVFLESHHSAAVLQIHVLCDSAFYFGVYRHEEINRSVNIFEDELVLPEFRPYPTCAQSVDKIQTTVLKPGYYKVCLYNFNKWIIYSTMTAHLKVWLESSQSETICEAKYELDHYDREAFHY